LEEPADIEEPVAAADTSAVADTSAAAVADTSAADPERQVADSPKEGLVQNYHCYFSLLVEAADSPKEGLAHCYFSLLVGVAAEEPKAATTPRHSEDTLFPDGDILNVAKLICFSCTRHTLKHRSFGNDDGFRHPTASFKKE
jgi:hypothetical protein